MKKQNECYVADGKKGGHGSYDYYRYAICTKNKNPLKSTIIGYIYESDYDDRGNKPEWWWSLNRFSKKGPAPKSKDRFILKKEAMASLNKALNKRGYKLIN